MEELEIEGYQYLWDIRDGLEFLGTMQRIGKAFEIISDTDEMWEHFTGERTNGRKEEKVDQHETGR
jgi:hypothetical protein